MVHIAQCSLVDQTKQPLPCAGAMLTTSAIVASQIFETVPENPPHSSNSKIALNRPNRYFFSISFDRSHSLSASVHWASPLKL